MQSKINTASAFVLVLSCTLSYANANASAAEEQALTTVAQTEQLRKAKTSRPVQLFSNAQASPSKADVSLAGRKAQSSAMSEDNSNISVVAWLVGTLLLSMLFLSREKDQQPQRKD